ncbi:MAG: ATP-dependent DNA helicase [Actinomycetota bacterium]
MTGPIRIDPADWDRWLPTPGHPQIVLGGPGTGKSEFLVRRAAHVLEHSPGDGVLFLTFSRRSAGDLDARLASTLEASGRTADVSTYHSFARRLLETHADRRGWVQSPEILTGPDQRWLIAELLAGEDEAIWSPVYRPLLATRTFADEVTDFILRCREQLIDGAELAERSQERADWRGLPDFLERYDRTLREGLVVDYGTLLAEAAGLLTDPQVAASVVDQFPWILVDEYQDTTHAQAMLLKRLAAAGSHVTAAADPYQSIYSFRGTDLGNVGRFPDDFGPADADAGTLVLSTSFRTPREILDAAVRVTAHELPGSAGKVSAAPGDGSVEVYRFEQHVEEAEWIAAEIQRLHVEDGTPYERIAVFVRSDAGFLTPLSRSLDRRRIPHDRPDSRLVDQAPVRFILDLVAAATGVDGPTGTDAAMRRVLLGPMYRTPVAGMAEIERRRASRPWAATVRSQVRDARVLADLLDDAAWANRLPATAGLWKVWSTLPQIADTITDARRDAERAAWSSFAQVLARWSERHPGSTLVDYRRHIESDDFEATPLHSHQPDDARRVTVTTLHQAKGLDFDVVFVANAVEGVFPDLRARDSLLGSRHLQSHLPTDTAGYLAFRLDEERRLAYTAMTRATKRVVWTTTDSGPGLNGGLPSRFLSLAAGTPTVEEAFTDPASSFPPVTAEQMESSLRRAAANPAAPAGRRLAAIEVLARGAASGLRPPGEYAGIVDHGPDTGIIRRAPWLSPSQAELYETCPRRYALERRLGIGAEPSSHMEFGSLIHDVLEAVENAAIAQGKPRGTLDDALEHLDARFPDGGFGGGAFDEAWRARARTALENLYAGWPSTGSPVASELSFEVTRGPVTWVGRADRVEERDGSAAIVDYKTGTRLPSLDEAATSIQLGFYTLAANEDPTVTKSGAVTAAEMWFPMHPQKHKIATRSFDLANLEDIEGRMEDVAAGITAEDWTPTPGTHCDRCSLRSICPAMPEGTEAYAS